MLVLDNCGMGGIIVSHQQRRITVPRKVRPIRIEGDVAYVPLTQGYEAIIDAEDVPLVEGYNWCVSRISKTPNRYAQRCVGISPFTYMMHRVIMGVDDPKVHIDHIDGNGLDNRKVNLRFATALENQWNKGRNKNNSSGYKGVSYNKRAGKWKSRIKEDKKEIHLGYFDTPEEAYEAYCKAAKELHGEFHNLG
jgi:hypothetical protein